MNSANNVKNTYSPNFLVHGVSLHLCNGWCLPQWVLERVLEVLHAAQMLLSCNRRMTKLGWKCFLLNSKTEKYFFGYFYLGIKWKKNFSCGPALNMKHFYLCPLSFYLYSFLPITFLLMNSRAEPTCVITVSFPFYICRDAELLISSQIQLPVISWRELPSVRQWFFSSDCPKFMLSPSEMIKEESKCPHQQLLCSKPGLLLSMERTLLKSVS